MTDPHRKTVSIKAHRIDPAIDTHLLDKGLELIHVDDDAFTTHLTAVRREPEKVVAAAVVHVDAYRDDPMHSWSVLYLLDRAGLKEARELFNREARRPIKSIHTGCESEADLEELVAIQASEALARLGATDDLLEIAATHNRRAVRIAAARAAHATSPALLARLEHALGADAAALHWKKADLNHLHVQIAPAAVAARPGKPVKPAAPALTTHSANPLEHARTGPPPKDRPLVGNSPIPKIVHANKDD